MLTIEQRVAKGAAWLDEKYPGWWAKVDIATLAVSSCRKCVLAQVYDRVIPEQERGQVLAQVLNKMRPVERRTFAEALEADTPHAAGGFNVLTEYHDGLNIASHVYGFALGPGNRNLPLTAAQEFAALTDEWTRVIISRRLDAHPDVRAMTVNLRDLRVKVPVGI